MHLLLTVIRTIIFVDGHCNEVHVFMNKSHIIHSSRFSLTGIYKVGDEEDHKKWKSNFRCALRSVPDIKEITEKDQRKGQKAARIYQLLDEPRGKIVAVYENIY